MLGKLIDLLNGLVADTDPEVHQVGPYEHHDTVIGFIQSGNDKGLIELYQSSGNQHRALLLSTLQDVTVKMFFTDFAKEHPNNYLSYLFLGNYIAGETYRIRGGVRAEDVSEQDWKKIHELADEGIEVLRKSLEINDDDPLAALAIVNLMNIIGVDKEVVDSYIFYALDQDVSLISFLHSGLNSSTKKWGGSYEKMFSFARKYADIDVSKSLGLPFSYSANTGLVPLAHIERWLGFWMEGEAGQDEYFKDPNIAEEISKQFNWFLKDCRSDLNHWVAANNFAVAFYLLGDNENLQKALEFLGGRYVSKPWCYVSYPEQEAITDAIKRVGLSPAKYRKNSWVFDESKPVVAEKVEVVGGE